MTRTPFAIFRRIQLVTMWYGEDYDFYRPSLNEFGEPEDIDGDTIQQTVRGIYHSSERSFVELLNSEGVSVKSTVSKGIICEGTEKPDIQQGDEVKISEQTYHVTTIEPVFFGSTIVAYEISVEELVEGVEVL